MVGNTLEFNNIIICAQPWVCPDDHHLHGSNTATNRDINLYEFIQSSASREYSRTLVYRKISSSYSAYYTVLEGL